MDTTRDLGVNVVFKGKNDINILAKTAMGI